MVVPSARIVIGNRNMKMTQRYDMAFLLHCGAVAAKNSLHTAHYVSSGLVGLLALS